MVKEIKKNNSKSSTDKNKSKSEVKSKNLKMSILGQYLKDLSFESPNTPVIFKEQISPDVNVNVNVAISKSKEANIYESSLQVRSTLKYKDKVAFVIEVDYKAIVEIICDDEDAIKAVLVTEVPKLLFPYVRQIISNTSVQGGFPPLNIAPISFEVNQNKH